MRLIIRWCLSNRPVVLLFALIVMGAGLVSVFRLNQEYMPSVEWPAVYILITEPGASPEVVDRDVTQATVSNLKGLTGLKHLISTSSQGFSFVEADFSLDSSLKDDTDAVSQRMSRLPLPPGVGKPLIQTYNFTAVPTMQYSLAATDGGLVRATKEANDVILPALDGASDTAQVKVVGGEQSGITVTLDPDRLTARGISPGQVQQALAANQVDLPAGATLRAGTTLPVEVLGSLRTADDLRNFVVGLQSPAFAGGATGPAAYTPSLASASPVSPGLTGVPVKLGDVARVSETTSPLNGISRTDGIPSLEIQVIRASNGNAVTVSNDIKSRIQRLHLDPADDLRLTYDAADGIKTSINDLLLEALLGAFLAVAVIFLFLGSIRATLVTAVSLPASVLVALLGTNLGGFSLNIMTLAGLTVAIGRIVDDAIVVLENSVRHLQQGEGPREAALNGASEVATPVISSTLATVAVFLPIGLVGGLISRFFLPFSVTVAISLVASLLVALTVIPVLVSLFLQRRHRQRSEGGSLARVYQPVLAWSIHRGRHKAVVLVAAAVLLFGSAALLGAVPQNFFGVGGSDQLKGQVTLPAGTSTDQTSELMKRFEAAARRDRDVQLVQVTMSSSDYGAVTGYFNTNEATINILLKSKTGAQQAAKRLKQKLDELYGSGNSQLNLVGNGPTGSTYSTGASGRDPAALRKASDMMVKELRKDSELTNVRSDLAAEKPELQVTVDASKAQAHGLNPEVLALSISSSLSPQPVGKLGANGSTVSLQLDPNTVTGEKLGNLTVAPGTPLREVATISDQSAPTAVSRVDGTQQASVTADITAKDTGGAISRATARIQKLTLPSGVTIGSGVGLFSEFNNSFTSMLQAMAIAIAIVFIILVAFFRSVVTPFVILTTIPLSLIGAFVALFVFQQALGLPALLGILMVFGIVVSNAVLLVHVAEDARSSHSLEDALILAGTLRVRPILMTAAATIMALLPVAVGISTAGGGGLISQPLAIVVEGGMVSSTALTLIVVPVVYSILRRGARRAPETVEGDSTPAAVATQPA